ncbi:hypothetical protein BJ166DRAFT_293004 [Pestalotiopsis sp. NC0098]|nr:hypothetical protein BJ166DRAFT_293004 [Pestalotiopsis sp. NC0098]
MISELSKARAGETARGGSHSPAENATSAAVNSNQTSAAGFDQLQKRFTVWENESVGLAYRSLDRWEERKYEIEHIYLEQNKTLKETRKIMKERGFEASDKVYKSYFKKWKFSKYKRSTKATGMQAIHEGVLPIQEQTKLQPTRKQFMHGTHRDDPYTRRDGSIGPFTLYGVPDPNAPQPYCISPQRRISTPGNMLLQELLSYCMKPNDALPRARAKEMYQVSNDLTMAHGLFLRGLHQLGGTYCERAFTSIHLLTERTSEPNLLVLLTTQVMCPNRELAAATWKYLAALSAPRSVIPEPTRRLFWELYNYMNTQSFDSYLDLVADRIGTELGREKQYSSDRFSFFPTHYLESARKELHNARQSREYNLMARFTLALQDKIGHSPHDARGALIAYCWNLLIRLHAMGDETAWKHEDVLLCATDLLDRAISLESDGVYFEIAATAAIAAIHRARWNGSMASGDPRHSLAVLYLERSVDVASRHQEYMGSSFLENLEVLEQWYREVGDVHQAEATISRQQQWMQLQFDRG